MTRFAVLLVATVAASGLHAQFGGLSVKKPEVPKATAVAPGGMSMADALTKGGQLIAYVTIATDQGMRAMDTMVGMYPPEKVAKLKEVCAKYSELSTKRKDGNIDAEQYKVASQAGEEAAKLEGDWKSYQKDKSKTVNKAHAHLGLMLLADGLASKSAPDMLKGMQATASSVAKDPLQVGKLGKLQVQIATLGAVVAQLPAQTKSFGTVRMITKKIADAEKIKLAADLDPAKVKDNDALTASAKEIE